MNTKAIILAAGSGSRLQPLTDKTHKSLIEVGGVRPLVRMIEMLESHGVDDILVITGYMGSQIKETLGDRARYREFKDFESKNNLHTLMSVENELAGESLVLYADLIFDSAILKKALYSPHDIGLIVDTSGVRAESPSVMIEKGEITKIDKKNSNSSYLGITKFSADGTKRLISAMREFANVPNAYYTDAINALIQQGYAAIPIDIKGAKWAEIDSKEDLVVARDLIQELS
jgi:L-glutamine-phosphate cytidylyltransferase